MLGLHEEDWKTNGESAIYQDCLRLAIALGNSTAESNK